MLKQFIKLVLCSYVVVLATSAMSHYAFAQLPPPVSPWLGMTDRNRNTGTLGPYLSNVKPLQDQMRASSALQGQLQSQQQALRTLQEGGGGGGMPIAIGGGGAHASTDMKSVLNPPRELPSAQRQPAGYNQYIHYYPPNSLLRRPVPYYSPVR